MNERNKKIKKERKIDRKKEIKREGRIKIKRIVL
jgi:hypothetical protein